jgi:NAD(P)-dependent dehydrogenase (short-subunit alcohol dehydrogenase family)
MTATKPKPRPSKSPVLLVTGGDTGIGLGIARKFAEAGYRMAIGGLARRREHRVAAALRSVGRRAHPEQCRGNLKNKKKTRVDGRGEKSFAPTRIRLIDGEN